MSTLLVIGLANAACAAVLALAAWLAGRLRCRPALVHALWLVVLLKLVTPPLVRPGRAWRPAAPASPGAAAAGPARAGAPVVALPPPPPPPEVAVTLAPAPAPDLTFTAIPPTVDGTRVFIVDLRNKGEPTR